MQGSIMTEEERRYLKMQCSHCGNVAPMRVCGVYSEVVTDTEPDGYGEEAGDVYEILKCPGCNGIMFGKYFWHDAFDPVENDISFDLLYPSDRKTPVGLSAAIVKEYEAALKVRKVSSNAFGVLVRRVLELVCIDRGAQGHDLFEKLQYLSSNGEMPSKLVDVAAHIRVLGNIGAHAALGELTDAEVSILDDLCRAILEYVYSAPHLAQKAQDSLDAMKLKKNKLGTP
jgi:hypothetical protein